MDDMLDDPLNDSMIGHHDSFSTTAVGGDTPMDISFKDEEDEEKYFDPQQIVDQVRLQNAFHDQDFDENSPGCSSARTCGMFSQPTGGGSRRNVETIFSTVRAESDTDDTCSNGGTEDDLDVISIISGHSNMACKDLFKHEKNTGPSKGKNRQKRKETKTTSRDQQNDQPTTKISDPNDTVLSTPEMPSSAFISQAESFRTVRDTYDQLVTSLSQPEDVKSPKTTATIPSLYEDAASQQITSPSTQNDQANDSNGIAEGIAEDKDKVELFIEGQETIVPNLSAFQAGTGPADDMIDFDNVELGPAFSSGGAEGGGGFDQHEENDPFTSFFSPRPLEDEDLVGTRFNNQTAENPNEENPLSPIIMDGLGLTQTPSNTTGTIINATARASQRTSAGSQTRWQQPQPVTKIADSAILTEENVKLHSDLKQFHRTPTLQYVKNWLESVEPHYPHQPPNDLQSFDLGQRAEPVTPRESGPKLRERDENIRKEQQADIDRALRRFSSVGSGAGAEEMSVDQEPAGKKHQSRDKHRKHQHHHCDHHHHKHKHHKRHSHHSAKPSGDENIYDFPEPNPDRSYNGKMHQPRETAEERKARHDKLRARQKRQREKATIRQRLARIEIYKQWISSNIKEKARRLSVVAQNRGDMSKAIVLQQWIRIKEIKAENEKYQSEMIRLGAASPI